MNEHLLIGTPAYNGMVHIDYVHSLMSIGQSGITFTLMSLGGESLITRARNAMLSQFYHNETFSHLLFLDGDIRISGASVRRLIDHHRDVIGAPVPLKQNPDEPRVFNLAGAEKPIDGLSPVTRIGTAVFMLSRQAAKALVEDAMQSGSVYRAGNRPGGSRTTWNSMMCSRSVSARGNTCQRISGYAPG